MAEIKEQYEISLWRDVFEQREGDETARWHEDKVAIIGGNNKKDGSRAFNPNLTIDIYGQETLKFDMYSKYYDEDGQQVDNPYLGILYNEAKVKVNFRGEWHDFIVKSVTENHSDSLLLSFECQALAIYELSKSGYDITFSEGNENNVQTASQFMEDTLEGSGWDFERGDADLLEEVLEQGCMVSYETGGTPTTGSLYEVSYDLVNGEYVRTVSDTPMVIQSGSVFLVPYSDNNRENQEGIYVEDGQNIIYDAWSGKVGNGVRCISKTPVVGSVTKYRVNKVKKAEKYVYNTYLNRYVSVYKKDGAPNYYGYETYTSQPYLIISKRTEDSVMITLMNVPTRAAVFKYYKNGTMVSSPETHESSYMFSGLSANTQYTFKIEVFDSNGRAIDTSGNSMYNADGTPIAGTGPAAAYSITGSTMASGQSWDVTVDDFSDLESTAASNFRMLYFEEGQETKTSTSLPNGYEQVFSYEKSRTLDIECSNRFNITQQIAETFEVWCRYIIEHDNTGAITRKYVLLSDDYGQENKLGFRYGVNLSKITRDVKSDELVTKLYVTEIETSTEDSGYCSIADAEENPSGEEFLIDFSYFIDKGMLTWEQVQTDLYDGTIGYYPVMKQLNKEYNDIVENQLGYGDSNLINQKLKLTTEIQTEKAKIYAANESISTFNDRMDKLDDAGKAEVQEKIRDYNNTISSANSAIAEKEKELEFVNSALKYYQEKIDSIVEMRKQKNNWFYTKYSRYIQEGTWNGENYIEPNSYYYDAQRVLSRSARPKVSYQLDVVDIGCLVDPETHWEYAPYAFKVGDMASVIDTQYFGYESDGAPRKEKVIVSSVTYYFDTPEKNSIEIQNYTTEFQDLFSALNASVQSLELNKNTYAKADNFTSRGALTFESLKQSFEKNKQLSTSNVNSTVVKDDSGITLTSNDGQRITKLFGDGIILSSDGGETWKTGIYGGEINTQLLKAGEIDTAQINIMVGNSRAFLWDQDGITAYMTKVERNEQGDVVTTFDYGKYVRFNQDGIAGEIKNSDSDDAVYTGHFKLGWDGLELFVNAEEEAGVEHENTKAHNTVVINVNDKFTVRADGCIEANNGIFRGNVYATDGVFNGTIYAKDGEFTGTIRSAKIISSDLIGGQLMIGGPLEPEEAGYGEGTNYNFYVNSNGEVVIKQGNIQFGALDEDTQNKVNDAKRIAETANGTANTAKSTADTAKSTADTAKSTADTAKSKADSAYNTANDAYDKVDGWAYGGSTYIDGSMIATGTVLASKLIGGTVQLLDVDERQVGGLDIVYTTTGYGVGLRSTYGGLKLDSAGNIYLSSGYGPNFLLGIDSNTQKNVCSLTGGYLVVPGYSYGSENPQNWTASFPPGTVYFRI